MYVLKGLRSAEKFVRTQGALGSTVCWDGWDLIFFNPDPRGQYSTDGTYRGEWGFDNRVKVNDEGIWEVDPRNVLRPSRRRNRRK